MPINYLELQPQVAEYCQRARDRIISRPEKVALAIDLLRRLSDEVQSEQHQDLSARIADSPLKRSALPAHEALDHTFLSSAENEPYALLASDGSQITSSHHDILPLSVINTSTIFMVPGSGQAPRIQTQTEFIRAQDGAIAVDFMPEQLVNSFRDVRELQVLAQFPNISDHPLIALGDGPLELFQEPRSGEAHQALFQEYLQALYTLSKSGSIIAGYTDKPRADLVVKMLEWFFQTQHALDISGITDADIFSQLLSSSARSSIFALHSPSSSAYQGDISLHFFYLNVGSSSHPWIVRVETTASAAAHPKAIALLQHALLAQCLLMGTRPYPYILHRAHEEAVVHFEEREGIMQILSSTLAQMGIDPGAQSNKLNAKELGKRTRLK
jgi:hypothetical protein